jgi:hypothetical protein
MMNPDMAITYLDFVVERHRIWSQRQAGEPAPWTSDPILASRKFTNVFRVLDVGSQFLLRELLQRDEPSYEDTLMRCFLYRFTNRPEPWEYFDLVHGRYPVREDLDGVLLETWNDYRGNAVIKAPIFGSAYNLYCGSENPGVDKMEWFLENTRKHFSPSNTQVVAPFFEDTQQERFDSLCRIPRVGPFLAMQILTDFGYSLWAGQDLENEFIVAGPGAVKGAKLVAPEWDAVKTILWAQEQILSLPDCPTLELGDGRTRTPSLMDCQNLYCEYDKLVRYQQQPLRKNPYHPAHPGPQATPTYPRHW